MKKRAISTFSMLLVLLSSMPADSYGLRPLSSQCGSNIFFQGQLIDEVRYSQDMLGEDAVNFFIQNNRKQSRRFSCSCNCRYCYARTPASIQRLKQTQYMSLDEIAAIIEQVPTATIRKIQLNGEDTLDDLESFWRIITQSKTKAVKLDFFTNGAYLLRKDVNAVSFFTKLREAIEGGSLKGLKIIISWDMEKVDFFKKSKDCNFHGRRIEVIKAMAGVLSAFREVFPYGEKGFKTELFVWAHPAPRDFTPEGIRLGYKEDDKFVNLLRKELGWDSKGPYPEKEPWVIILKPPLELRTTDFSKRVRRPGHGVIKQTAIDLIRKMEAAENKQICFHFPFVDMATNELVNCFQMLDYRRERVDRKNFLRLLFKPYQNPRTRHMYLGPTGERHKALMKQFKYAIAIKPEMGQMEAADFKEFESVMFGDLRLMQRIELLFLLADMLSLIDEKADQKFILKHIPKELVDSLLDRQLLADFLRYYVMFEDKDYPALLQDSIMEFKEHPNQAVASLKKKLVKYVLPKAADQGILPAEDIDVLDKSSSSGAQDNIADLYRKGNNAQRDFIRLVSQEGYNARGDFILRYHWDAIKAIVLGEEETGSSLKRVEVHPSSECNLNCRWCPRVGDGMTKPDLAPMGHIMPENILLDTVRSTHNINPKALIMFCGYNGEPLLNPATAKAMSLALSLGMKYKLTTNGTILTDEICDLLMKAERVNISLDATSPEEFAILKEVNPPIYNTVMRNIKRLCDRKRETNSPLTITVSVMLQPESFRNIPKLSKQLKEYGISALRIKLPDFDQRGKLTLEQVRQAYQVIDKARRDDACEQYRVSITTDREVALAKVSGKNQEKIYLGHKCFAGRVQLLISVDGSVFPCCQYGYGDLGRMGNVHSASLEDIYKGEGRKEVLARDPRHHCGFFCIPADRILNEMVSFLISISKSDPQFLDWVEKNIVDNDFSFMPVTTGAMRAYFKITESIAAAS